MMPVEGVHTIEGLGTVVTGRVERGVMGKGGFVEIVGLIGADNKSKPVFVKGVQAFHKDIPEARAGQNVGMLLRGVKRDEVVRGQVIAAPGSITSHVEGAAEIFVLTRAEGGRHKPFGTGYMPQFFFGTTDVTGVMNVGEAQQIHPGDRAKVSFRLQKPVGFEVGMRFAMREGGRTIGAGIITEVG